MAAERGAQANWLLHDLPHEPKRRWLQEGAAYNRMEDRPSFLKKRSKKLFGPGRAYPGRPKPNRKSFLLLFFKKEYLPCPPQSGEGRARALQICNSPQHYRRLIKVQPAFPAVLW
jgi:hypothetical protein